MSDDLDPELTPGQVTNLLPRHKRELAALVAELKPCPFCGGTPYLQRQPRIPGAKPTDADEAETWAFSVICRSCAAQGGWSKASLVGAVRHWQTRQRSGRLRSQLLYMGQPVADLRWLDGRPDSLQVTIREGLTDEQEDYAHAGRDQVLNYAERERLPYAEQPLPPLSIEWWMHMHRLLVQAIRLGPILPDE